MRLLRAGWLCLGFLLSRLGAAPAPGQEMRLTAGGSIVIDYATDVGRISTSNADVVDAVAVSTREVLLHAKAPGTSTVIVWPKQGARTVYSILVEQNLEPARRLLKETFPQETMEVQGARDSLSLTGQVSSQAVAERAAALLVPFAKVVVNNLVVAPGPEKQVLLRVKFAELNRVASNSFGVNLISTGATNTIGSTTTGQFSPPQATELKGIIPGGASGAASKFTITDALNIFAFRPDLNLAAFIRALESQSLLQILAEPNLVTTNGKDASFLVGGEFPVPVLQGGAAAGSVTIMFKEFGIRLTFKPEITGHGTIRMYVKPEVSAIDVANSISLGGFTIPALATRRMETNIELGHGQSFVIAGLIDDRVTETLAKVPGLANIPILGVLFKSRLENRAKTELIVMVTPEITTPVNTADVKPAPQMKETLPGFLLAPSGPAGPATRTRKEKK
jgi:pilus assembly protein CpaC